MSLYAHLVSDSPIIEDVQHWRCSCRQSLQKLCLGPQPALCTAAESIRRRRQLTSGENAPGRLACMGHFNKGAQQEERQ
jgi:hypothetical protein